MSEDASDDPKGASGDMGLLMRLWRAIELLVSVQASTAKREASEDAKRILAGIVMVCVALALLGFAAVLAQAALVFAVQQRFALGFGASTGIVAGGDAGVALVLLAVAKSKLTAPVLTETRAMVKKAAAVLLP